MLRRREDFVAEGGLDLEVALNRYQDAAGQLRLGKQEADDIESAAQVALERLHSAPMMASIEAEHGPMAVTPSLRGSSVACPPQRATRRWSTQ